MTADHSNSVSLNYQLQKSFEVIYEELLEAVYSHEWTTFDEENSIESLHSADAVQRIPYVAVCQHLRDDRQAFQQEMDDAMRRLERKHAAERRDLLNCKAEIEELKMQKERIEALLEEKDSATSDKELQFKKQESAFHDTIRSIQKQLLDKEKELDNLRKENREMEETISNLTPYREAHEAIERTLANEVVSDPIRGIRKCNHGALWRYVQRGTSCLHHQLLNFRDNVVQDFSRANVSSLASIYHILCIRLEFSEPSYHSQCHHISKFRWDQPKPQLEQYTKLFKEVTREIVLVSGDQNRSEENLQRFAEQDTEDFEVQGKFYVQNSSSSLLPYRPVSLVPLEYPEHIIPGVHKQLWKPFSQRPQFVALPPKILPTGVVPWSQDMSAYITDLIGTLLAEDVGLMFGTNENKELSIKTVQEYLFQMFDRWFPAPDAASLAIRNFLFSIEVLSESHVLVRILLRCLIGELDACLLRHFAVVHILIHTNRLSTPNHLGWILEELFPNMIQHKDTVLTHYLEYCGGTPSPKLLSSFYLNEFLAKDYNPGASQINSISDKLFGMSAFSMRHLSILKCERIKHELFPYVNDQVLRALFSQSAKLLGFDSELPYNLCTWILTHLRILMQADNIQLNIQDRLDGLPEQQRLVNMRSRMTQLQSDAAYAVLQASSTNA
eukprot:gene4730-6827_t